MRPLRARRALLLAAAWGLVGCASPPRSLVTADQNFWAGRLALQVEGDRPQSFSAAFELRGAAQAGELTLYSPLGGVLAKAHWSAGVAELQANGQNRQYTSMDALTQDTLGAALPLASLFAWLGGQPANIDGWHADLTRIEAGRLTARRLMPLPIAELRIVLEQP
jgi:outer membrane lipoprotein LolB